PPARRHRRGADPAAGLPAAVRFRVDARLPAYPRIAGSGSRRRGLLRAGDRSDRRCTRAGAGLVAYQRLARWRTRAATAVAWRCAFATVVDRRAATTHVRPRRRSAGDRIGAVG